MRAPRDDALDSVFAALANPTRRAILDRLAAGEATVSQLAAPFDVSLPAVTNHLSVLHHAGLLVDRKQGRSRVCSLRAEPLDDADRWLARYRAFWDERCPEGSPRRTPRSTWPREAATCW